MFLFQVPKTPAVHSIWVFPKIRGTPKWMVYNGKPCQKGRFGGTIIFGTERDPVRPCNFHTVVVGGFVAHTGPFQLKWWLWLLYRPFWKHPYISDEFPFSKRPGFLFCRNHRGSGPCKDVEWRLQWESHRTTMSGSIASFQTCSSGLVVVPKICGKLKETTFVVWEPATFIFLVL